mmetsp:Transcript_10282/g.18762  ORF Transcript_10282/g.18762 Transcript_10282/m.18762 type:complete len:261 (+) Transcript_10282:1653-2435(+)
MRVCVFVSGASWARKQQPVEKNVRAQVRIAAQRLEHFEALGNAQTQPTAAAATAVAHLNLTSAGLAPLAAMCMYMYVVRLEVPRAPQLRMGGEPQYHLNGRPDPESLQAVVSFSPCSASTVVDRTDEVERKVEMFGVQNLVEVMKPGVVLEDSQRLFPKVVGQRCVEMQLQQLVVAVVVVKSSCCESVLLALRLLLFVDEQIRTALFFHRQTLRPTVDLHLLLPSERLPLQVERVESPDDRIIALQPLLERLGCSRVRRR